MYREIKKKKLILDNRKPYTKEAERYLAELDDIDLAYTSMRLGGSALTRAEISQIHKGELLVSVGLEEHARVAAYRDVLSQMDALAKRRSKISEELIFTLYQTLTERNPHPRKNNPVIYEWSYNPPHSSEVGKLMDLFMDKANTERADMTNYVLRATEIHHTFLAIYPLAEYNEEMARLLFYYYLMTKGYGVFALDYSDREYNAVMTQYMKDGDLSPFAAVAERSLYNKMEIIMQMTAKQRTEVN